MHIYKESDQHYILREQQYDSGIPYWRYIQNIHIKTFFVSLSPKTRMTTFSRGFGPKFKGNSILVQISRQKYLFIESTIYSFQTSDPIQEFYSPVGNNDVPYPVAIGTKFVYLMLRLCK